MISSLFLCLPFVLAVGNVASAPVPGLELPLGSLEGILDSRNDKGDIQEVLNDNRNVDLTNTNAGGIKESGGPQSLKGITGAGLNARNLLQLVDLTGVAKIGDVQRVANLKGLRDSANVEDDLNKVLKNAGKNAKIANTRVLNKSRAGGSGPQGSPACDPLIRACDII